MNVMNRCISVPIYVFLKLWISLVSAFFLSSFLVTGNYFLKTFGHGFLLWPALSSLIVLISLVLSMNTQVGELYTCVSHGNVNTFTSGWCYLMCYFIFIIHTWSLYWKEATLFIALTSSHLELRIKDCSAVTQQVVSLRSDAEVCSEASRPLGCTILIKLFNCLLATGHFLSGYTEAFITPIVKKAGLDATDWSISNL